MCTIVQVWNRCKLWFFDYKDVSRYKRLEIVLCQYIFMIFFTERWGGMYMQKNHFFFFALRESPLGQLLHHVMFCSDMLHILHNDDILCACMTQGAESVYLCIHITFDDMVSFVELIGEEYDDDVWLLHRDQLVDVVYAQI